MSIEFEFSEDWACGEADAKAGKPHCEGRSKEYDEGYGFRYMFEQMNTVRSDKQ